MPSALLCVSVTGETTEALRAARDAAREADLVELRLDSVGRPDVAGALAGRRRPVIVTCRPAWEGGWFTGSEADRRRLLAEALALGAEYVDLEWRAGFDRLIESCRGRNVVLSMHDFEATPADLPARYRAMRATGAAVVKMAVRTRRLSDLLPLLELGASATERARVVVIGMGRPGLASRVLAARFGSCWAYAGHVAPGQIDPVRMLGEFRFRRVSAGSQIYGVVGNPIAHSVSPAMHNAGFAAIDRDAVYLPLEAADADDFFRLAEALPVRGASITAPFKETMFARVADVDAVARRVGALNTVRFESGRWSGTNTDVAGFLDPLTGRFPVLGARVAVLGAGGAARAVAVALSATGARTTIYARDPARAAGVAGLAGGIARRLPPCRGSWDLLVNATPVGTCPGIENTLVGPEALDGRMVYDLVYNPRRTRLLVDAARAGCATLSGLEMLVAQARRQFEWWTGTRPPAHVFEQAALERLSGRETPEPWS